MDIIVRKVINNMKFENIVTSGWEAAFRGMRNPKESWHLSDSFFGLTNDYDEYDFEIAENWIEFFEEEYECEIDRTSDAYDILWEYIDAWLINNGVLRSNDSLTCMDVAFIGPRDMRLAKQLISGGSEHRKFLRQIHISVDITAPLYWWKEFDTYKIGTVANSTSTMHKITSKPITLDCFEIDDYVDLADVDNDAMRHNVNYDAHDYLYSFDDAASMPLEFIEFLESLRLKYLETKDKRYWKELIRWLPESWLQTRTVTMNYENVINLVHQRSNHKLDEWKISTMDNFIKKLPYAEELIYNRTSMPYTFIKDEYLSSKNN